MNRETAAAPEFEAAAFGAPAHGTPGLGKNGVALLDLLRALAANAVLVGHASAVFGAEGRLSTAGTLGVGVFFILSGFLILQSSLSRLRKPAPHFAPYMIDRVARIFTAYVPALILVAAINAALPLGHWGQQGTSTGPVAFLGNLFLLQDYPAFQIIRRTVGDALYVRAYNTAEPFWTIPIEFWIYVVFGLAFFGLFNRERPSRLLSAILCVVALPVVIWNAAAGGGNGLTLVWLIGAAAGYVWSTAWCRSRHLVQIGSVVVVAALICLLGRGAKLGWNFQDIGFIAFEALLILGAVSLVEGMSDLPRLLRGACTFLASYSYSLYLVHNTVLVVVRQTLYDRLGAAALPVALILAHAAAYALYLGFERHYRQVGRWLKRRLPAPAGQTLMIDPVQGQRR